MPTKPTTQTLSNASPVNAGTSVPSGEIVVRELKASDSIGQITSLLHRAYAKQVAMGLRPLAGRQDDATTADRAAHSEAYVAIAEPGQGDPAGTASRVVGIILFEEKENVTFPTFFLRPEVCHFAQFGVDPDFQGRGIGRMLLEKVEQRAREKGAKELALSMAEPDRELFDFYVKRGFRIVEHWQWPYTNYRSCILSKAM